MEASLQLGRIRGIAIGIHSTWLIVFGLLTYSLAAGVFPDLYEGWSETTYWVVGAVAALLLFVSVLAHEIGHAVTAQARGIPVKSITLFIFGGVAQFEEESEDAGDEFWTAVAGPAVSVVVAVVSGAIAVGLQGANEQLEAIFSYLATANLILVLFNLIPGYPLDGGRVLRAILWKTTDSVQKATKIASTVGMIIGYGFIVLGIFLVFQNPISGIWLIAIGWFLRSAAEQSYQQLVVQRLFSGVRAGDLMTDRPVTVGPDVPIDELVANYILARNVRGLPVVDDGELVGIITLNDVKDLSREEWPQRTVRGEMTPRDELVLAAPNTSLRSVVQAMSDRDIHQIPVVRDGALVGLLTRNAVIRAMQLQQELGRATSETSQAPETRPRQEHAPA